MDPVTILEIVQLLHRKSRKKGGLGMLGIKNLLALIGLVVVAFVGAGWYLGWYKIGEQADANGKPQLRIQVNSSQVVGDLKKAEKEVIDGLDKTKAAVTTTSGQAPPAPPAPLPPIEIQVQPQMPGAPGAPLPLPPPPSGSWKFPESKN